LQSVQDVSNKKTELSGKKVIKQEGDIKEIKENAKFSLAEGNNKKQDKKKSKCC
jgi:hypothetical protein